MRVRFVFFFAATMFSLSTHAAPCREAKLEKVSDVDPECLYYKGTRLFRSKDYAGASVQWQALVDLKDISKKSAHLQDDANNNLGYLYYMGWGVEKDRMRAIQQYWIPAEQRGHDEAGYHLCHAYATSNPKLALGYCSEALRRYERQKALDVDESEVVSQLKKHITTLTNK